MEKNPILNKKKQANLRQLSFSVAACWNRVLLVDFFFPKPQKPTHRLNSKSESPRGLELLESIEADRFPTDPIGDNLVLDVRRLVSTGCWKSMDEIYGENRFLISDFQVGCILKSSPRK